MSQKSEVVIIWSKKSKFSYIKKLDPEYILIENGKQYSKYFLRKLKKLGTQTLYLNMSNYFHDIERKRAVYRGFIERLRELELLRLTLDKLVDYQGEEFVEILLCEYFMDLKSLREFEESELRSFRELIQDVYSEIVNCPPTADVYLAQEIFNLTLEGIPRILVICKEERVRSEPGRLVWYLKRKEDNFNLKILPPLSLKLNQYI